MQQLCFRNSLDAPPSAHPWLLDAKHDPLLHILKAANRRCAALAA